VTSENLLEILNRCLSGDTTAFRLVMEEYQSYAYVLAFRILTNEEDTNDVVQEAFIRLWKNLHRYNPSVKFTTWLYSIVTNLCYDKLRSRKARRTFEDTDSSLLASLTTEDNPGQSLDNAELATLIGVLTEELSPAQKMIFILRDIEGLSVREVCDVLHVSKGSVKTNLVYARKQLRIKLEPYISD
jgi:RNA polymerase sigma-70 factor, ECF subfamily